MKEKHIFVKSIASLNRSKISKWIDQNTNCIEQYFLAHIRVGIACALVIFRYLHIRYVINIDVEKSIRSPIILKPSIRPDFCLFSSVTFHTWQRRHWAAIFRSRARRLSIRISYSRHRSTSERRRWRQSWIRQVLRNTKSCFIYIWVTL